MAFYSDTESTQSCPKFIVWGSLIPIRMGRLKKYRQYQVLLRVQSNRNRCTVLVGRQNGEATLEHSLAVSYKVKHT